MAAQEIAIRPSVDQAEVEMAPVVIDPFYAQQALQEGYALPLVTTVPGARIELPGDMQGKLNMLPLDEDGLQPGEARYVLWNPDKVFSVGVFPLDQRVAKNGQTIYHPTEDTKVVSFAV